MTPRVELAYSLWLAVSDSAHAWTDITSRKSPRCQLKLPINNPPNILGIAFLSNSRVGEINQALNLALSELS